MIKFYKTQENRMTELPKYSEGCWVSAVCPTPDEIHYLIEELGVDAQYISAALDEEESSRIESEDGQTLVIIDVPYMEEEQEEKTVVYTTTSIGIILTRPTSSPYPPGRPSSSTSLPRGGSRGFRPTRKRASCWQSCCV